MVRTAIICTIGPACSDEKTLRAMARAGMDVARLNFSHGTLSDHLRRVRLIRKINASGSHKIKVLVDLEGNRVRIGELPHGDCAVKKNKTLYVTNNPSIKKAGCVLFDYAGNLRDIKPGNRIFIDDGTIALSVKRSLRDYLVTEVLVPGVIKSRKGVNIPSANLKFNGLSGEDRTAITFAIDIRADFIAQSFVRSPADIIPIRTLVASSRPPCRIIAKTENRQGIENADRILSVADGIMIARGDMGVSIPIYQIPIVQKQLIHLCNKRKKVVITATQMLESMTEHLLPTRAEVTDVSNAVFDGTDMVMLSGETAVGKHPVETVRLMDQILAYTETYLKKHPLKI